MRRLKQHTAAGDGEDTRCDGSVAGGGSAEVVECELRRPAVEDEQSRLVDGVARLGAEPGYQQKRAMRRAGWTAGDRGQRQAAGCVLQRPRTRAVLWCGAALCGAERRDSRLKAGGLESDDLWLNLG